MNWNAELRRILRFFWVALICCGIDTLVGLFCLNMLHYRLTVSVIAGFTAGLGVGYALHALWTFRHAGGHRIASAMRFTLTSLLLLCGRLAFVWLVAQGIALAGLESSRLLENAIYICMLGFSFCLNYIMCRIWVFK